VAIVDKASALEVGRAFAALVRAEPVARRLWVHPHHGWVDLWLVIDPADHETTLRLYGLTLPLFDRFPADIVPRLHVLDPRNYGGLDPSDEVPREAVEIPLERDPG